ncbi:uncharacterized protein N7459_007718 [Penicillium hispanicum]|uniref:uncharacterized protein n=1 Tax=Penicillium hispanicum TaxID=1080232 RepID=UPI00253FBF97|nr:uncharacterized protein N7459_007718 [Penicillium hispanicum]KAJ5578754.1 hypothetical protein N7459_007718 [Penicillium hispanicum]
MSGFGNVMKGGWHPKGKDGGKESWRSDFKGINQVVGCLLELRKAAGWMGKGKDPNASDRSEHVSQPLSSLKDPAAFGPPPKHVNYHGAAALPNETTPDRRGLGAPLLQDQIEQQDDHQRQAVYAEEQAAQKPQPPPVPYRVNTTGLSTNNLPPPPVRRLDSPSAASSPSSKLKPQLPPRLPPRDGSAVSHSPSPPPAYTPTTPSPSQGYINQEATSRLANAGVSVPALDIGRKESSSRGSSGPSDAPVNELQSRFSQMRTNSGSPSTAPHPPVREPLPVRDAEDALPPRQGFRERHADTIDAGRQKLGGVTSRFNTFVADQKFSANANKRIPRPPAPSPPVRSAAPESSPASDVQLQGQAQRKKPPPPPPKRAEMRAAPTSDSPGSSSASTPPPVPLSTRPR